MKKVDVKKVKQEVNKAYGIPEVVARIAEESDNQTVREKWDELTTIVHLVHKDKVLKKRQEANDLSKTFDEIEHRLRLVKNATKGHGIDFESYDVDKDFISSGSYPNVSYSFGSANDIEYDPSNQLSITFPEKEEDKNQLSLPFPEDVEKYIEEHTLSTPLSEYEAIEKLNEDD
jgi:hypothetical protein